MCAQFGRWNFDGSPTPPEYLGKVRQILAPYGPDRESSYRGTETGILYCSFATVERADPEMPLPLPSSGAVLTWEGRLDNGARLAEEMGRPSLLATHDAAIVSSAWEKWNWNALARLSGDWALAIWKPRERLVLLAADILASRHLYFACHENYVAWSSIPDPLVLHSEQKLALEEEYLAGWLASFPAAHLTPFRGISRVPPASAVMIRPDGISIRSYWSPDAGKTVLYRSESEYADHFLHVFSESIRRRVRSAWPVLAELSGGIDSSSIVCMADKISSQADRRAQIDTVSYYCDDEPHWDERPFFEAVERQRARTGLHVDASLVLPCCESDERLSFRPGMSLRKSPVLDYMIRNGHRVLLSGIGGDEFLGGVPTPLPELENLFARGNWVGLWRRMFAWAVVQRRPWIHLLRDTIAGFAPPILGGRCTPQGRPAWLDPDFAGRQRQALSGYARRLRLFGPLPSFQENVHALDAIRRQLACTDQIPGYPIERRYPLLDRDLLEFLFAIPREQLVRPGERRSLMRRSLAGIVPQEVLGRRRKAWVSRAPLLALATHFRSLSADSRPLLIGELGIVNSTAFLAAVDAARQGREIAAMPLMRALSLEQWLRSLERAGALNPCGTTGPLARLSSNQRHAAAGGRAFLIS